MRTTDWFDDFLSGNLTKEQKEEFQQKLNSDTAFAEAFEKHSSLVDALHLHEERVQLRKALQSIHEQEIGIEPKILPIKKDATIKRVGKTVAFAAGVGLVAVLSTLALLSTGGYLLKQQKDEMVNMGNEITKLKYSQDAIVKGITSASEKIKYAPANFEGSGFALNNKGYILTSWHVVNGADSIFISNANTTRALTRVIFSDPKVDVAVLKIEDPELMKNWQVPFTFSRKCSDIGDKVFTLGYPRKDIVYGEGALSALSGYRCDTSMYQISIPINPGNSGGPLLDEQGNIIGLIRGKITSAEATSFAIKSREILNTINAVALDSAKNELTVSTKKNILKGLKRSEQIKRINPYVFNVMVYKAN